MPTHSIYSQEIEQMNLLEELKTKAVTIAMKSDPKFKASYNNFLKEQKELKKLSEDCDFVNSTLFRCREVRNSLLVAQSTSSRARIKRATDHLCAEGTINKFISGGVTYYSKVDKYN